MKKILMVLVGIAVAVSISAAYAAETTKTTTKTTPGGKFIEKEKSKLDTGTGTETIKTTAITEGQFTTEKGKVVLTPHKGDVKVEKLKFKAWNDNDPANNSDNTVIMYKGKEEVLRHVGKDMKINHLEAIKKDKGTIYSTYNPLKDGWEISYVE